MTAAATARLSRLRSRTNSSIRRKCRAIAHTASIIGMAGEISSNVRAMPGSMGFASMMEPISTTMYSQHRPEQFLAVFPVGFAFFHRRLPLCL